MKPYIDISHDETGQPEYSIHALGKDALKDIIAAITILQYMLLKKIRYELFNGIDLNTENENRVAQLDALINSAMHCLKQAVTQK